MHKAIDSTLSTTTEDRRKGGGERGEGRRGGGGRRKKSKKKGKKCDQLIRSQVPESAETKESLASQDIIQQRTGCCRPVGLDRREAVEVSGGIMALSRLPLGPSMVFYYKSMVA